MTDTTDFTNVIDRYLAIWNETDAERRRDLIARTWRDDARYLDPLVDAKSAAEIDATVAAVQGQFPGLTFRLGGPIDAHHELARFTWELAPAPDAEAVVIGFDVAMLADDGRLQAVYGFLDKVPTT